jgi:transcription elongation factor Elf1
MGRKRSVAHEVLLREARRKKQRAVERLYDWGYCPRCRKKSIETDYVQTRRSSGVIVSEKTLIDGPYGKEEAICKMAAAICRSCGQKMIVWLLPNESLIELYHLLHDQIRGEIMFIELFEWLWSEVKESREDVAKRKKVEEEKRLEEWRESATIIVVREKEKIPEPRLVE